MNVRPALVLAMAASLLAAGASQAASKPAVKPVCNLVQDAKDDTFALRYQDTAHELAGANAYGPAEGTLDIVSADIASDGKTITAVLRVAKLAKTAPSAPGGLSYRVQFAAPGEVDENLYLNAATDGTKDSFTAGTRAITANVATKLADVKGVFDLAKNEVRISAPLATFAKQGVKSGSILSFKDDSDVTLDQTASRGLAAEKAAFADVATSEMTYKVGAPSCVVPGK